MKNDRKFSSGPSDLSHQLSALSPFGIFLDIWHGRKNVFKLKRILFRYRIVYRWTFAVGEVNNLTLTHAPARFITYISWFSLSLGSRTRQNNLFGRCQCIIQQVIGCVKKRKEKSRRSCDDVAGRPLYLVYGVEWRIVTLPITHTHTRRVCRSNTKFFSFSAAFAFAIDRCTPKSSFLNQIVRFPPFRKKKRSWLVKKSNRKLKRRETRETSWRNYWKCLKNKPDP